jgi:hypothetical protein
MPTKNNVMRNNTLKSVFDSGHINPEVIYIYVYIYNRLTLYNAIVRGFELKKVCESIYTRTQI